MILDDLMEKAEALAVAEATPVPEHPKAVLSRMFKEQLDELYDWKEDHSWGRNARERRREYAKEKRETMAKFLIELNKLKLKEE